jgi:hypothetical protein
MPEAEIGLILNLGDFFHADSTDNQTTRGTRVDVDTRWSRMLEVGITLMIDCVHMALEKHKKVIVRNNPANHDWHTGQMLGLTLKYAFKNNKRVHIEDSQNPFYVNEFGNNMIISAHGHTVKPAKMQGVITNYFPEIWGRTEHRYCYLGHFHHEDRKEDNALVVEIFNTLASQDAWHYASGYRSKRNMKSIVLHKEFGEIERHTYAINRS